jgi:hypothetical protein
LPEWVITVFSGVYNFIEAYRCSCTGEIEVLLTPYRNQVGISGLQGCNTMQDAALNGQDRKLVHLDGSMQAIPAPPAEFLELPAMQQQGEAMTQSCRSDHGINRF